MIIFYTIFYTIVNSSLYIHNIDIVRWCQLFGRRCIVEDVGYCMLPWELDISCY